MPKKIKDIGKRLFIELGTPLQVVVKEVGATLGGELIGMEVGKYIIIKINGLNGVKKDQLLENKVEIKYLHATEIFGFTSTVTLFLEQPEELIFLSYPDKVENFNLRSQPRIKCYLPVKVELEFNMVSGNIVDINSRGCRCRIPNFSLSKNRDNDKVVMHLQSTNFGKEFQMAGHVRSVRQDKDEVSLGIMFDDLDVTTQTAIRSIVPTLELHNKKA